MADNLTPAKLLASRIKALEDQRTTWDPHWQEVAQFIYPHRGQFVNKGDKANQGDKKMSKVIESCIYAVKTLAAGLQGGLTSPSRPWFRLGLDDQDLQQFGPVRDWLGRCERTMYTSLARSNFYPLMHTAYIDEILFGTTAIFEEEDIDTGVRFHVMTVGEFSAANGENGRVNSLYRKFWLTAKQIVEKFGIGVVPDAVKKAYEENPFEYFTVLHGIEPNTGRNPAKADNRNMAFASTWAVDGEEDILAKGGFQEQSFFVPRWDMVGGDVYGRSPAMEILPDVKMLQEMAKSQLVAVHKANNPPMIVPESFKGSLSMVPGGINWVDPGSVDAVRPLLQTQADLKAMEAKLEGVRMAIRRAFFNDLFVYPEDVRGMTATEVMERKQEKLLLLGPVIERQQGELLDPLINRTFMILLRQGRLPEPPRELSGQTMKVEYISLLAQAQRALGTTSINQLLSLVNGIAPIKPDVVDKINFDAAIEEAAEMFGTPPKIVVPQDQVDQTRSQRAQAVAARQAAEAQTQAMQNAGAMAQTAQTLSQTDTGGQNALTDMLSGA